MAYIRQLIIKEWFKFFAGSFLALLLIFTAANLISGFLRSSVTPQEVLFNYILDLPANLKLIFPVSCLIGSLFSINKLKSKSELVAIFASGYSRREFIESIAIAACVISFLQFFVSSYVEPFAKSQKNILIKDSEAKFDNLKSQGLRASTIGSGKIWYKSNDYFFSFTQFIGKSNQLTEIDLYQFDNNYKLKTKIAGNLATFKNDQWIIDQGKLYSKLNKEEFPVFENIKNSPLPIKEKPNDFREIEADITTLNVIKLFLYIRKLSQSGININEFSILLYEKFSNALICLIFALTASVGIFTPSRRNSSFGKNIGIVFVFTIFYWLINSYFLNLGKNSLTHPLIACFGVPAIFVVFLAYYFMRHGKLR